MKSDLSQTLRNNYTLIIDEDLLQRITSAGDNVLFQYNSTYIVKIYQEYTLDVIEQSCVLLEQFNNPGIIVKNNAGEYVTKFNDNFVVLMNYLQGRVCNPSNQYDVNKVITLIKKIPKLNLRPNVVFSLDKECELKFNSLLTKCSSRIIKYKNDILLLDDYLRAIDARFLQSCSIVTTHHDINPNNVIISNQTAYLLDWDKSRSAYYIDEVCRAAFLFMLQAQNDKIMVLESFLGAIDNSISLKQYFDICFLAGMDVYAEIVLCCLECESEEMFLFNLPNYLHPPKLYENLELIILRIKEFNNF